MSSTVFAPNLLQGQVALVTGGGTGIGAAIARELGQLGADVTIASRKTENIQPAAAGLSKELGRTVHGAVADIRDRDSVRSLVDEVMSRHGRIDILINNAGGQFLAPAATITDRGWDAVVATNLTGTWNATRAVADAWMLEHGGRVVSITMLTQRAWAGMAHSVAARAGVESLTRTLAVEWSTFGINLNCVAPGYIASSGLRRYPNGEEMAWGLQASVPAKRLGRSEEVAWAVAYLVGPAGDYITGQVLTVDGGRSLWGEHWPVPDPPEFPDVVLPQESWEKEGNESD